jgi:intein/homing endonuclease
MKHGMVFPKINVNNYKKEFYVEEYKSNNHNKQNINLKPKLSNELLYAFGRFVGDGHVNNHQVSICGHIDEYKEVLDCIMSIKNEFNIQNHTEYKRGNIVEMYISSIELRNNFKRWFGEGAYNKTIPDFIFHLSKIQIRSFLNGYYDADGYRRGNTQQISTVSKYLSYQINLLEGLLGNSPSLRFNDNANCWSIEYSITDKVTRNTLINNIHGNSIYPIMEIKEYKPKRNDERVYDLTVEDDESFIVGLSTVHNCHRIGQKDVVNIYPVIFPDTIDDYVYSSIESKRKEIVKVMDNEDYKSNVRESVLAEVIEKIKEKHKK